MEFLFWLILPILIVSGINEIRKWGAQDAALKASQEREEKSTAAKKAFEEKWRAKAVTSEKQSLIIELQEEIRTTRIQIDSLYWDEGGMMYNPDDPYNDYETNEHYKTKHKNYDNRILECEKIIKFLYTLS